MMQIEKSTAFWSKSAILAAVKKQQAIANWKIEEASEDRVVLSFSGAELSEEDCIRRFDQQLADEQLRERLELDFGHVRDRLVELALSPIIKAG